jgi:hypothetical protein
MRPQNKNRPPLYTLGLRLAVLGLTAICSVLVLVGCGAFRGGYETATYAEQNGVGDFSIRSYDAMTLASTPMRATSGRQQDGGFMRLFGYISGDNETKSKLAMTTPVFMEGEDESPTMSFVLPDNARDEPPQPTGESVTLRTVPSQLVAVVTFNGRADSNSNAVQETRLRQWMEQEGLIAFGLPKTAQYDPPWTPGPLRRNEVIIPIRKPASAAVQQDSERQ